MRGMHGAGRRYADAFLRAADLADRRLQDHDPGRPGHRGKAAPGAAGLHRRAGILLRLLPQWLGHDGRGLGEEASARHRCADPRSLRRTQMPLRSSHVHPARGQAPDGSYVTSPPRPPFTLTRRQALFAGGALVVTCLARTPADAAATSGQEASSAGAELKPALTPPELDSWVAVKPDGAVIGYFGKVDIGLGIQVAIAQIIADELDVRFDQVSIVMGDTAATINQGGASGSTGLELGSVSLRHAASQAPA